ncbi:MAG: hypothetical protein Q4D58_05820 [Synergistaceae bacterium]|nr:hypothetical protein [Synergistaceae bacterium]
MAKDDYPPILNSRQAAAYIGISTKTLQVIRDKGMYGDIQGPPYIVISPIKGSSPTGGVRYVKKELDEWIDKLPRYNSTCRYVE